MAETNSTPPPPASRSLPRRRVTRARRKLQLGRTALVLALLALVAIIAIPAVGYYWTVVRPRQVVVVRVNDKTYDLGYYIKQLRAMKWGSDALGLQFDAGVMPFQLLQIIEENELIRQAAPRFAITVTDGEVDEEIKSRLEGTFPGLALKPKEGEEADQAQLRRNLKEAVRLWTSIVGLSEGQYRDSVRADLLRNKLRDILGVSVPTIADQARFSMIKVGTPEKAEEVTKRLKEGAAFAKVAEELSEDDSGEKGGEKGWAPRGVFPSLDAVIFGLGVGEVSEPVKAPEGWYVVHVAERAEESARLQVLLLDSQSAVFDAIRRFDRGESFATLARELNKDPELARTGGDLGLLSVGAKGGIFDHLIAGLPLNTVSDAISTAEGTFFVLVTEAAKNQEIEKEDRDVLRTRVLQDWLTKERAANLVERVFDSEKYAYALAQIKSREELAELRQQQQQQGQIPGLR